MYFGVLLSRLCGVYLNNPALCFGNSVIHNKIFDACNVLLSNCAHCLKTVDLFKLRSFVTHCEASNMSAMVDDPLTSFSSSAGVSKIAPCATR